MDKTLLHTGHSMEPTLKPGDTLQVVPYKGRTISPGDVIVFKPAGSTAIVCHRVMSIDSAGYIRTRGDNNEQPDLWALTFEAVLGGVRYAARGKKVRRIFGGVLGRIAGNATRFRRVLRSRVFRLARPCYRSLAESSLFRWIGRRMPTRVVRFSRSDGGQELQLFIGRRMMGRLLAAEARWRIKPPFRLFVDEATLPGKGVWPVSQAVISLAPPSPTVERASRQFSNGQDARSTKEARGRLAAGSRRFQTG